MVTGLVRAFLEPLHSSKQTQRIRCPCRLKLPSHPGDAQGTSGLRCPRGEACRGAGRSPGGARAAPTGAQRTGASASCDQLTAICRFSTYGRSFSDVPIWSLVIHSQCSHASSGQSLVVSVPPIGKLYTARTDKATMLGIGFLSAVVVLRCRAFENTLASLKYMTKHQIIRLL